MICSELPIIGITAVTGDPTEFRGSGLTSTGFVYTNPLVGVEPQTPGGDDNG